MSEAVSALKGETHTGFATVAEAGLTGMVTIRADLADPALAAALAPLGLAVPALRQVTAAGGRSLGWMSPDELLLVCGYDEAPGLAATLAAALAASHALVVNVSDMRARFTVSGAKACEVMMKLCPLDFATLPAMEMRRAFGAGDLTYLANLCHNCGACHSDCQFAPPHEFAVNVPKVLAEVRNDSYARYVWPGFLAPLFARNWLVVTLVATLSVAAFLVGFAALTDPAVLFGAQSGPGAFYRILPHNAMVAIFGTAFLWSVLAVVMSCIRF